MQERGLLRRVAAILFHRRAGFSANGMGVWKVPDERDRRDRPADGRVPRHLALLPAPDLRGLALLRSSRWPTAARRRSATRSSTRSPTTARASRSARRSTRSTEFKKIRLLYFTDDFQRLGTRARGRLSRRAAMTGSLTRHRAPPSSTPARSTCLPGGVNSPVRAMRAIGRDPIFIERGEGAELHRRRRQPLRRLRLLVGAADPRPRPPRGRRGGRRRRPRTARRFGAPTAGEVELAEEVARRDAGGRDAAHDVVGHRGVDERDPPRPRGDRPRRRS